MLGLMILVQRETFCNREREIHVVVVRKKYRAEVREITLQGCFDLVAKK